MSDAAAETRDALAQSASAEPALREIGYERSHNLGPILDRFGVTLLGSTDQAGKFCAIRQGSDRLNFSFHNLERTMGVAASANRIAVGSTS
jgi:hypothetical protein